MPGEHRPTGFVAELLLIARRAREAWRLVPRQHKLALGSAALVMALTSLCNTSMPILLGMLVDGVQGGTQTTQGSESLYRLASKFLLLIGAAYLVREALNVVRRYLVENTCTRINREISLRLLAHLMKVHLDALSRDKVGALHGKIFRSVDGLVRFVRLSFLDFIPALFTGLFALLAAVGKYPLIGLAMIGVIPVAVFLTLRQMVSQKGVRLALLRSCEEIDGAVVEQLNGIEFIRAANTQTQECDRLGQLTEDRRKREIRHHFAMSLFGCAKALNEGFFHIIVLGLAIHLAIQNTISFGDVLTFSLLFLSVMAPLGEVHRVLDEGHESSLRVGDLLEMLAEPADASFATQGNGPLCLVPTRPVIEVKNLRVQYTTAQGIAIDALDDVSLTIRHGETIGVAGRSGCGKSTWLKTLLRLVHPAGGAVLLGGVPLEQVSREQIAHFFGYVGQAPFVFSGSIADNIAYGTDKAAANDIMRAAQLANLHDEIMTLPGAYQGLVREKGQNLSGGQRQRLALARILLKHPAVLILDEATSALDNISERHVQRSLGIMDANRTTILVAHRLSTLKDADRIYVFDEGRIVEVGTYDELSSRGGVFSELVHSAEHGLNGAAGPAARPAARPAVGH